MLLELGLWLCLEKRVKDYGRDRGITNLKAQQELHSRLMQDRDVMIDIRFFMGSAYHDAVKTCLTITEEELAMDVYVGKIISRLEDPA